MRRAIIIVTAGLGLLGLPGVGVQPVQAADGSRWNPTQSVTANPAQNGQMTGTLFTLGGIGVNVWSPLEPQYDGSGTYRTYAGQPASPEVNLAPAGASRAGAAGVAIHRAAGGRVAAVGAMDCRAALAMTELDQAPARVWARSIDALDSR